MSSVWLANLLLMNLSAGVAFFTKCRWLSVVLVVLFMLVAVAAWQFQRYM
ncbi:hypothetical protein CK204_19685 [Klebsiella pneumoniae]|nr:hypothetical protein CK204_19685 [Klebsiella pneumoniae]